jgi:hypothetical protein
VLWISLPAALLLLAATIISQGPIQKKTGTGAVVFGIISAGSVAYIVAVAHLWWALLLVGLAIAVMYICKDKGILFKV